MAPIQSIFIPYIQPYWTPELIATFLYDCGIASTAKMEVYTSMIDEYECKSALIEINQWLDTEDAYEFICSLKFNGSSVVDISDEFWIIYMEPKTEHLIDLLVGEPTETYFTIHDFEQYDSMLEELIEDNANLEEIEQEFNIDDDISTVLDEEEFNIDDDISTVLDEEEINIDKENDIKNGYVYEFDELELPDYPELSNNYYGPAAISTY
jgi:hypothetical protein